MKNQRTIHAQLVGPIRAAGIGATARAVGLDRANLSRWLSGTGRLADPHVDAICAHLGLVVRIAPRARCKRSKPG